VAVRFSSVICEQKGTYAKMRIDPPSCSDDIEATTVHATGKIPSLTLRSRRRSTMKAPKNCARLLLGRVMAVLLLALPASAGNWKTLAPMPAGRDDAAVETINGIIYVVDGSSGGATPTLQAFNPTTNTWTTLANIPLTSFQTGAAAGVINSQLYIAGGWTISPPLPNNTLFMYDPPSNTWTTLATISHLSACGGAGVINSKFYVTTACNGFSGYYSYLDVYDPLSNAWTSLPGSASVHAYPAFGVINDELYIAGGQNDSGAYTSVLEAYNPATNSWTTLAPMPTPIAYAASVALNGQLYVFGGFNGTDDVATVQAYDPHKNKWRTLPSLPAPISLSAGVVVYGLAFMEGGDGSNGTTNQYVAITPSIP
jgi:N-acetylneuraminic acid mutarotase